MLLQEISDKKLYKLRGCSSFKAYCEKVFHFSRSYGYRLIAYCNIWNLLSDKNKGMIPERVIRALSMVEDPTERQEIWDKVKIKTGGELPTYKTVEEEIREFRKQKQFTKANFDPASFPDKVFCMTLKKPVIQAELAQELIDNSNGNYGKLLNATREMLKANYLNDEAQQTLKQELLKRYSEWLDKQFEEKNTLSEYCKSVAHGRHFYNIQTGCSSPQIACPAIHCIFSTVLVSASAEPRHSNNSL